MAILGSHEAPPPGCAWAARPQAAKGLAIVLHGTLAALKNELNSDLSSRVYSTASAALRGAIVLFQGRLASMGRKDAVSLVRDYGGQVREALDSSVNLVVLGEADSTLKSWTDALDPQLRAAILASQAEVVSESEWLGKVGLLDEAPGVKRWFTPAMLAELVKTPLHVVRKWRRLGLIQPVQVVHRLEYYDLTEVNSARRLVELLATGVKPEKLAVELFELSRKLQHADRPLSQLAVILRGKQLLLRRGEGLVDKGGQYHFDFDTLADDASAQESNANQPIFAPGNACELPSSVPMHTATGPSTSNLEQSWRQSLIAQATALEDDGDFLGAIETYRTIQMAAGPDAEVCFRMAEMMYLVGELAGARERYYMAIELDDSFIEARASLGCVLMEMHQVALAAEAFRGVLTLHPDYPDVHYHLGRCLDVLGEPEAAEQHWQRFVELAPDSSWREEAIQRLQSKPL